MNDVAILNRTWHQTLSIAVMFWAACLVLVMVEITMGSNLVVAGLYFLSIPTLVALLTWANIHIVLGMHRSMLGILALGATVLLSSSVIIFVGLLAAANLKALITGV